MDENMALFMDKLKELVPFAKEREQAPRPAVSQRDREYSTFDAGRGS